MKKYFVIQERCYGDQEGKTTYKRTVGYYYCTEEEIKRQVEKRCAWWIHQPTYWMNICHNSKMNPQEDYWPDVWYDEIEVKEI